MKSDKIIGTDSVHAVDIDGTLILWNCNDAESAPIIWNENIIRKMREAKIRRQTVIVWTAGGLPWLNQVAAMLKRDGYDHHVDFYMCKPKWYHDDEDANSWMRRFLP